MTRRSREIRLFDVLGAPVFVHWSVWLLLPLSWLLNRDALKTTASFMAYFVVIFVHELGHAWMARRKGLVVHALRIYPLHGLCVHERPFLQSQNIAIAWGGVAAQAMLLLCAVAISEVAALAGTRLPEIVDSVLMVWVVINLMILLFNLWPVPPLDGAIAWRVLPLAWKQRRIALTRLQAAAYRRPQRLRPGNVDSKVVMFDRKRRNPHN